MATSTLTVAGINPSLNILGNTQQFVFNQPTSSPSASFNLLNNYIPTISINSNTNLDFRNNLLSGFRFSHLTNNTDTYGTFILQYFVNGQTSGTNIFSFSNSTFEINAPILITQNLDLNNNNIINLASPINPTDVANKGYVDTLFDSISTITLTGNVTGSGLVTSPIITTLNMTLDQISAPVANLNLNSFKIINLADPVNSQDAATKNYVDTKLMAAIYMTGNVSTTSVIANTFTKINGTTTSSILIGFTMPSDNRIQYVGINPINAKLAVSISAQHDVIGGAIINIAAFKNGTQITAAVNSEYLNENIIGSFNLVLIIDLTTNDYVEIFVSADSSGNIIVNEMNFLVTN